MSLAERIDMCLTFAREREKGTTKLARCPYDDCCDGSDCPFLGETLPELREDTEQERRIVAWKISRNNQHN